MSAVRYNSVDNETGVSYAVVVGDEDSPTTVGVVTRESSERTWIALATGRKNALKDEFATRKAAAAALVELAEEKAARAAERKAARAAEKAAQHEEEMRASAEIYDEVLSEDREAEEAVVTDACCGTPDSCVTVCPDEVDVETTTAAAPSTRVWVQHNTTDPAVTVTAVEVKPTVRERVRRFFGRA